VNAYLAAGGAARGVRRGEEYVDVGTLNGYWNAIRMLENRKRAVDETSGPELAWSRSG
jgi:hypothetical protein